MAADPGKTEPATPKRRTKVRQEGNVPKSQEATKTITLIAGFFIISAYFPTIADELKHLCVFYFTSIDDFELTPAEAYATLFTMLMAMAKICVPIMLVIALSAFLSLRQQVGSLWTTKVFKFKLENFNIIAGIKRSLFSKQTYVRLGKTIALAIFVGYVPYMIILGEKDRFADLYYTNAEGLAVYILETGYTMVLYTMLPMISIAIFDLWHVFNEWEDQNKMTKQEIKDEHKQSEGDPVIKSKQRQKMMEILKSRMMQQVPKADVIVTNPTHYAVALKYDQTICPAPYVLAKGKDNVALKIKEIAREHGVPIKENRLLARSLYASVEVGDPISEELYKAVASIIAEIWRVKGKSN